jgi:plasmid stabilization system protein ParE
VSDYVLSLDAEFDLDHIWEYIAADSIDAADRWITKLFDAFEALAQTPAGHHRDDLTSYPVLFWPVGAYVIVIARNEIRSKSSQSRRGSRDIPAFLSRRDLQ